MRITSKAGRALVLLSVLCPLILSALGFRNQIVWGAAAFGLLPILLGAVAWTLPARHQRDFVALTRQRNALLICLALLLSAPLTRWPLQLSFQLARPTLERLRSKALQQAPYFKRLRCIMGIDLKNLGEYRRRSDMPFGWIQHYHSRNPLLREVRLWHDGQSYVLFDLQTRFGVVLRGSGEVNNSWEIVD